MVTTHHSSKGRQFAAVVIPELVQEVFPAAPWVEKNLKQERRLFYVAFTRAKRLVALVYGDKYRKRNNTVKQSGASQFVQEVYQRTQEDHQLLYQGCKRSHLPGREGRSDTLGTGHLD